MKVVGLTGGVGSGKSRILAFLELEYKAQVIMADLVAKELMEPGRDGYHQVVAALGTELLTEDGSIDRPKLSRMMFSNKQILNTVNSIIHPMVWDIIRLQILDSSAPLIVVEAALLEKEKDDIYDELWYLYTSRENRIKRLMAGRGYSKEKCLEIMAEQPSDEVYRTHSQRVIDNDGTFKETKAQIRVILGNEG